MGLVASATENHAAIGVARIRFSDAPRKGTLNVLSVKSPGDFTAARIWLDDHILPENCWVALAVEPTLLDRQEMRTLADRVSGVLTLSSEDAVERELRRLLAPDEGEVAMEESDDADGRATEGTVDEEQSLEQRLDPYVHPHYRLSDESYKAWLERLRRGGRDDSSASKK